ncbi:M28 family metallopeptidase [Anaerolentibacter hominis]|uniref:M28 family metallopeptidase n=1 Tax=Anaerolentibacter hominis TaxID=3079009 RepID=UPI0031B8A676
MFEYDDKAVRELLHAFSGLVRLSGEPDGDRGMRLIEKQLESYGIPCRMEEVECMVSNPGWASFTLACGQEEYSFPAYVRSYSASVPEGIYAPVFYDSRSHEDMSPLEMDAWYRDAAGKILLTDNFYEDYVKRMEYYKAAGILHIWRTEETYIHNETVCPVWGTASVDDLNKLPRIPVIGVTHRDGEILREAVSRTQEMGVRPMVRLACQTEKKAVKALLPSVYLPGETEKYVLVAGHADSWFEGVTDNGTGNALCVQLAAAFRNRKLKRGLKIAWWPAHSNGRYAGSAWYCDQHFEDLDENCVALLNVDSPGCMGAEIVDLTTCLFEGKAFSDIILHATGQKQVDYYKHPKGSDLSFFGPDIPVIINFAYNQKPEERKWDCAGSGGGWWWHTTEDSLNKVDYAILKRDTMIVCEMAERLCCAEHLPFDPACYLTQFEEETAAIKDSCGPEFDFDPVVDVLARLKEALTSMPPLTDEQAKRIGGMLNKLLYTSGDAYGYENTFASPKIPGLQCARDITRENTPEDVYLGIRTKFIRQRNRFTMECKKLLRQLMQ